MFNLSNLSMFNNGAQRPLENGVSLKNHTSKVIFSAILMFALVFGACSTKDEDDFDLGIKKESSNTATGINLTNYGCGTNVSSFIKAEGNDKGDPLSKKVGDIFFVADGENLVVYLFSDKKINNPGVVFGKSLEDFERWGMLAGGGKTGNLKDKNIIDGKVANYNSNIRESIPGGVKFTFNKKILPEGDYLCIVYCNLGWGQGIPNGPSGTAGNNGLSTNNGEFVEINVTYDCIIAF